MDDGGAFLEHHRIGAVDQIGRGRRKRCHRPARASRLVDLIGNRAERRRRFINAEISTRLRYGVPILVCGVGGDLVGTVRKNCANQCCNRHCHRPRAVHPNKAAVVRAIERDGDGLADNTVRCAANCQSLPGLCRIQNVIASDGINRQRGQSASAVNRDGHVLRCCAAVSIVDNDTISLN